LLSASQRELFDDLALRHGGTFAKDIEWDARYEGTYRVPFVGHNMQPWLRDYEATLAWPRRVVDVINARLRLRSFYLPGEDQADERLGEIWRANNLDSESGLVHKDALIYGRAFVSVGAPAVEGGLPVIRVESPRELTARVNPWTQQIDAALRLVAARPGEVEASHATLYLPNETIWLERFDQGQWVEQNRDPHNLGRVPIVMFLNRRRSGNWAGVSEMADVAELADIASRTLMDMQVTMEGEARQQKYALGVKPEDFVDAEGNQINAWNAHSGSVWMNGNPEVKVGVLPGANLAGFHDTIKMLAQQAAAVTGFPLRYFGLSTSNPPSGDAIRADEGEIVATAERVQRDFDAPWGWVAALAHRIDTGNWVDGSGIVAEWYDPSTPTYAARADAIQKQTGGAPVLSREGAWEEMGWSESRMKREAERFDNEASDPVIDRVLREFDGGDTNRGA